MNLFKKRLPPEVVGEIAELNRLVNSYRYVANAIAKNTMLIPEGKKEKAKANAIADILERQKTEYVSMALAKAGVEKDSKVSVDLKTGILTPVK